MISDHGQTQIGNRMEMSTDSSIFRHTESN
jgi:hypothetical protein